MEKTMLALARTLRLPRHGLAGALLWIALCAVVGCSRRAEDLPELGLVSGTVTMDGKLLAGAQVVFEPESGAPSVGQTDEAGRYELAYNEQLQGAVVGRHTVRISKYGEPGSPNDTENQIPEKFGRDSDSTAEVVAGGNTCNFDLESAPKAKGN